MYERRPPASASVVHGAVVVDFYDVVRGDGCWRDTAREQKSVVALVVAHADAAEAIDHAFDVANVINADEIVNERSAGGRHSVLMLMVLITLANRSVSSCKTLASSSEVLPMASTPECVEHWVDGEHGAVGDQQRVAIARRGFQRLCRHRANAAGAIVDDDLLAPSFAQRFA